MDNHEREKLVSAWIILQLAGEGTALYEENFWAHEKMSQLAFSESVLCWEIIVRIFNRNPNNWVLSNLAAGPLEDLLTDHGEDVIDSVEKMAISDERFRWMLRGVWRNAISESVWRRIQRAVY